MKHLVLSLLALTIALPARADGDNLIQNGDFSDGITHWYGGGRSPADYASDNPLQASDPLTSKGLIIPLHPATWTKIAQDFKGKSAGGDLTIVYKVSNDLAFSTKPDDYVNVPHAIGYDHWKAFNIPAGEWMIYVSDFGSEKGIYNMAKPNLGSTEPQTFRMRVKGLTPFEDKTITFAFPPGTGLLVITSVTFTSDNQ